MSTNPKVSHINQATRMRYSDEELEEFRQIIQRKIDKTKHELAFLEHSLKDDQQTHSNSQSKFMEDTAESYERDMNAQLAARLSKFLYNLENAMIRIENKTYGVCKVTGKLISKERLKAVPHTTMSMEAKMNQKR